MTTVTENNKTAVPERVASTRQVILDNYRKITEKIKNLKPVIAAKGRLHPLWIEYRRLKHAATIHVIALRIVKNHHQLIKVEGYVDKSKFAWTYPYVYKYEFGESTEPPFSKLLLEKKGICGKHLPHGANAGSFLKKAWTLIKKAS